MTFWKSRWGKALTDGLVLLGLFLFTCVSYLVLKPMFHYGRNGIVAQSVAVVLIAIVIFIGFILRMKKKLNFYTLVFLLFVIAFIVKLCYMLNTPYNVRQYDTITTANDGHEGYAWILFTTGKLPTVVDDQGYLMYQFYHPPLNAVIQAGWMHFFKPFLGLVNTICGTTVFDTNNMHVLYESTQILATMYMTLTAYFGVKIIMNIDKLNDKARLFGIVFLMFFPRLVQLSAQENNDGICVMFSFIALYYTLKWWKEKSWGNILPIAFAIGLAMMAKLAAATVALATAFVFIYEFVKDIISKDKKKIVGICSQFVVFLAICAPLGLWFQLYAMKNFHQPIGYVFGNLNQELSTRDHNFFERFLNLFDFYDMSKNLYALPFDNYNIFGYLIKTSIFGEFAYWQAEGLALLSIIFNYVFVLMSFYLYVVYLIKAKGEHFKEKALGLAVLISNALMMMYFNISMPYGCTMDFRYIVPIISGFGIMSTLVVNKFAHEKNYLGVVSNIYYFVGIAFIVSSSGFYLMCI